MDSRVPIVMRFGDAYSSPVSVKMAPAVMHGHVNVTGEQFLKQQLVGGLLLWKRPLVEISADSSVNDALRMMDIQNLSSLPVYEAARREYIGIISRMDIFLHLCTKPLNNGRVEIHPTETVRQLIGTQAYFKAGPWREAGILTFEPTASVHSIVVAMSLGVKHVMVRTLPAGYADEEEMNEMVHEGCAPANTMISQGDLVKFLCEHNALYKDTFAKSIHSLGLDAPVDGRTIVTASLDTPVISALHEMVNCGADAVAIVNKDDGRLISTLTATDLRGLRPANFGALFASVEDFLRQRHYGNLPMPLAVLGDSDLLGTAVSALVVHVHRVFVVDGVGRPISMLRLVDVIRTVYRDVHLVAGTTGMSTAVREE